MDAPSHFQLSRRSFVGSAAAGGLMIAFHDLAIASKPSTPLSAAALPHPGHHKHVHDAPGWSGAPGKARYRIEGMAKVTGQKIYARDFRAKDMPGWPAQERMAMILRAQDARRLFMGIDLSMLSADQMPLKVIQQADLAALNLTLPFSNAPPAPDTTKQLLVAKGTTAQFYGQPVAILIFKDTAQYRAAKRVLQFNERVVQYGAAPPPPRFATPYAPVNYLTRFDAPGIAPFSQVEVGAESNPFAPNSAAQPYNETAKRLRGLIDAKLNNPAYRKFEGSFSTQVLDPMFMEPEAGLAWLNPANGGTLNLVLGTQATNGDMSDTFAMFANPKSPSKIPLKQVSLYSCYPGGGFGGRDVSTFPALLAVTAALSDQPVRIAQDRYEQFQSGLKQLASNITHSLAVDKDGTFVAFKSNQVLPSGGNNNYSQFVAMLTAYCGLSGYNIKQAYVDAIAQPSLGVVAGSMRGFGGPQASFAVETLVDEAAVALGRDPIELREKNVLKQFDRTITGAPLEQPMTLLEICRRAKAHPLWRDRERVKREKKAQGIAYGVGFALANQAYGTGTDGVMAEVSLSANGEISVRSNCVDMGNGSATTLAISTASFLGNNASTIQMGDAGYFKALNMTSGSGASCNANDQNPPACDWTNPAWTASFSMSSSACLTAFHQVHVAQQAAKVLFETAVLPAAAAIWGVNVAQVSGKTSWQEGRLQAPGLARLALKDIATRAYAMQLPKGAMVHGLYQGSWVSASYEVAGRRFLLPIDGLALQSSASVADWRVIMRQDIIPPNPKAALYGRSLFAPSGVLIAVEVNPKTGEPKVTQVELLVDAGKVLQPDLLIGQAQGGIAMGIGYALLEDLPLEQGGAGDGKWNLDRYHVALASDMPRLMNITPLPSTESTAKGIAEAVLCPIAPAIGNAIAHATGKRFRSLPITAAQILGAKK
jgi:CO/xanthine dehydrogenase Mo-binding subunit